MRPGRENLHRQVPIDAMSAEKNAYGFEIARRTIHLDQSLVHTAGITTFL